MMSHRDWSGTTLPTRRLRGPRVPVEFALDVEGTTAAGNPFQLPARAIKISRGGATLVIDAELFVGSIVRLRLPSGGQVAAEVNGVWQDRIDGRGRIGIKLLDEDGWFAQ